MKPISELIDIYLTHLKVMRYSPKTLASLSLLLKRFDRYTTDHFGITHINHLNTDRLTQWYAHLSTLRTKKGHPLKTTAVNRHIIAVRGFITYLSDQGYVPSRLLKVLPYLKEPRQLPRSVLSHAQVKKLLAKMPLGSQDDYRNRAMLELLYSTGIRADELLRLNLEDVDFTTRTAFIHGKGDKERMVPIGKTALRHLKSYATAVRPFLSTDPSQKALFLNRDGRRLSYKTLLHVVNTAAKRLDTDVPVTPHTFRRSCTTELIRSGANMYHIKELLGHESLDTLKHYVKLTIIDLKKTHQKCHPREKDGD